MFYTAFPGLSAGIMYGVPPFGYNYLSPAPPLFATPFINFGDGVQNTDPFPLELPAAQCVRAESLHGFNFAAVTPISADPYFTTATACLTPRTTCFRFSARSANSTLLTVSYAGNEGHHLLVLVPANVGNPALCLSLSQPSEVAPGSATCGPFGEDAAYTSASGKTYQGTRVGLGPNFGSTTAQKSGRQFGLQRSGSQSAIRRRQAGDASGRLHLFEIDRSGVESRRADQSLQREPHARDLLLGYDAQLRGDLHLCACPSIGYSDATG
jgi:hypothetical protein